MAFLTRKKWAWAAIFAGVALVLAISTLNFKKRFFSHEDSTQKTQVNQLESKQPSHAKTQPNQASLAGTDPIQSAKNAISKPDVFSRVQAILSLREKMDPEAVEILREFLKDENDAVVSEAIDTLGNIGINSDLKEMTFMALADKARDKSFNLRGSALITAAMLGNEQQVTELIGQFVEEDYEANDAAVVRALSFALNAGTVPYLVELINRNDEPEIQKNAFNLLAKSGNSEAMNLLEKHLSSNDLQKQDAAVWALSRQNNEQQNQMLSQAIVNKELPKDAIAIVAKSPSAAEVFADVLSRDSVGYQDKINLLKILGANASSAPGDARDAIAEAMLPLLANSNAGIQQQALETLGNVAASKDMTDKIAPLLGSDNILVQKAALESFIKYLTPGTYEPLKELWYHGDEKMRRTAFFFSEPFLNQKDLPDLQKATQHNDEFIAKHSASMIKYLNPPK
jgi:HEAT repeat protein